MGSGLVRYSKMGCSTSVVGHSRLGPAGRRSSHVRYAPKATVGHQNAIGRDGPKPDSCIAANEVARFDHLIRGSEQRRWDFQAERFCSFGVNHKLKFCRLLNRKFVGFRTAQKLERFYVAFYDRIRTLRIEGAEDEGADREGED
jgi:hypothetical protein